MKVLLVHPQAQVRRRLRQLLGEYASSEIIGEADTPEAALEAIGSRSPDLTFLALEWPAGDSLELLRISNQQDRCYTIVVAPAATRALHALEQHGVDYLLEPVDRDRFRAVYEQVRTVMKGAGPADARTSVDALLEQLARETEVPGPAAAANERILVKAGNRALLLSTREIDWIEAAGNYVRLHAAGAAYIVRESISRIESMLNANRFARVHRSTIVNLERIRELRPWSSGEMVVVLRDGTELKLSRSYRKDLERRVAAG